MAATFFRRWLNRWSTAAVETPQPETESTEAEAQFLLGVKCASGQGEAQDYAQAAQWYEKAGEQNHSLAQFNLAMMYTQGQGVLRDEGKALMWMTRAAELGDAGAQYRLGVRQQVAGQRLREEAAPEWRIEALKWARLSAAQGYRGAEGACERLSLGMTWEEVAEGGRRAAAFVAGKRAQG